MSNNLFFLPHLGLGDHFLSNGLLRYLAKDKNIVAMPVKQNNFWAVKRMFSDMENLCLIPLNGSTLYSDGFHVKVAAELKNVYAAMGFDVKAVGFFGDKPGEFQKFLHDGGVPDVFWYKEMNVDISQKYESFKLNRSYEREQNLFYKFDIHSGGYAFIHDDPRRGRTIDRSYIDPSLKIITSETKFYDGDIVDYGTIIENAAEIHFMNSSFSDFADFLDLSNVKRKVMHAYTYAGVSDEGEAPFSYRHKYELIRKKNET